MAAPQCNNRKLLQWGLVLMLLSVHSVAVGIFKGASWAIGVSAAMSVLLFMLLFVIVFTKTAALALVLRAPWHRRSSTAFGQLASSENCRHVLPAQSLTLSLYKRSEQLVLGCMSPSGYC